MARRAGKAANRRARQRKIQRAAATAPSAAGPARTTEGAAASAEAPATAAVVPAHSSVIATSQLTASERGEYHYVERDLRDIAILTAVMAALLLVAWFAFRAFGLLG